MKLAIETLLTDTTTWAVIGCSPDPTRESHTVAAGLQAWGKRVIPVNPMVAGEKILGEHTYRSLFDIPDGVDVEVVDIFRRSELAGVHVDEAIARGVRGVWLQLDVIDDAAAARAREAGLLVVMDRCPVIEMPRLQIR